MKLIIAGGRDFDDEMLALTEYFNFNAELATPDDMQAVTEFVSGGARGADRVGENIARLLSIPVKQFIPDWDGLGKRAGFVRNAEMAEYADALLAFWDGSSKGTAHMIDTATKKGLIVKVVMY